MHCIFTPKPLKAVQVLFSVCRQNGPVFTNIDQAERKISSRSDQDQGKWLG